MSDYADHLKSLHTALVDSREGYVEALADAGPRGLTTLFQQMIDLRTQHHTQLHQLLNQAGEKPDESGSFMSTIHRTVIKVRSVISGLDESVLPGLIDGEQRILKYYDEVEASQPPPEARQILTNQRQAVATKIEDMQRMKRP